MFTNKIIVACVVGTAVASGAACQDDPTGALAQKAKTCAGLTSQLSCDTELHSVNPAAPAGVLVSTVCSLTCGVC